ncbi:MAG: AI-2E family transporter [Pirellulales bacterium]
MAGQSELKISGPVLVSCAALVVIVAGVRVAQPIIVPLVVAAFLAMICLPPLRWLQEKGLPTWAAMVVMVVVIVLVGSVLVAVIGTSVNRLREQLPEYQARVEQLQRQGIDWLKGHGVDVSRHLTEQELDTQRLLSLFGDTLGAVGSVLSDGLVIVFMLFFMLLEGAEFPKKLRAISGDDHSLVDRAGAVQESLRRYISLKTRISLVNALLVTLWLWWLGVDFALLWGLLMFLLNFIPNIGSFIAAVPAVALALLQLGVAQAIYAALGYLVIELVTGSIIEPRLMGRGLGLSPLVVFVSLIFWGWVLGPVGMLFSVPLTMIVKIVLDHSQDLKWVGVLLSAEAPAPAEHHTTKSRGQRKK